MKKIFKSMFLVILALVITFGFSNSAKAVSVYDSMINIPTSWDVTDSSGNTHSIDLESIIADISDTPTKEACESAYSSYTQADYRVSTISYNRYSSNTTALTYGSNYAPGDTEWFNDNDGSQHAWGLWENAAGFAITNDGSDYTISCSDATNSTTPSYGYLVYAMAYDDGFYSRKIYQTEGFSINYPSGYAGATVPSNDRMGLITGNVQCTDTSNIISAVHIIPDTGLEGNARITDGGLNSKNYKYYLSEESSYHLEVLCDGDIFYGPTVSTDLYNTYNWICAPFNDDRICAAS